MQTDFLIVGSGIAGITYALKVAGQFPDKKILIITKAQADETNTKYAQGGIAGVMDFEKDSFEKHIEDTLIAGDGLCDPKAVEIVVKEGVDRIAELIGWGAQFDKEIGGDYKLGKEGGHSEFRILHHKDVTGKEMERALLDEVNKYPNISIINHFFVVDLITQHHLGYLVTKATPDIECFGVYALNTQTNEIISILAKITVLATGGNGQVYRSTTNPFIATGDGVAMLYRAKGRIENMEFIQFHPTALYEPNVKGQSFLITEAVRGDGGILRNAAGEAFMERYDPRKDLAPRDIVARAIDNEMKISGTEHVYLDVRHIPLEKFLEHFPNIYEKCQSIGIDIATQLIPVSPAAHYSCGGIKTDEWGRTSIRHLYACGECACLRRMCLHRIARRQPAGQQFAAGGNGLCPPRGGRFSIADQRHLTARKYSGLECLRHYRTQGNDPDHPEPERAQAADERLCGHRPDQYPFGKSDEADRPVVGRNRKPLPDHHDLAPALRAAEHDHRSAEHDHRRLPDRQMCATAQRKQGPAF